MPREIYLVAQMCLYLFTEIALNLKLIIYSKNNDLFPVQEHVQKQLISFFLCLF